MANSSITLPLRAVKIPYSNFSWNANDKNFYYNNPNIALNNIFGFIVRPTNGFAILQAYLNDAKTKLHVFGYIPSIGSQIASDYVFEIYAIGN